MEEVKDKQNLFSEILPIIDVTKVSILLLFVLFPPSLLAMVFPKRLRSRISLSSWRPFSALLFRWVTKSKVHQIDLRPPSQGNRSGQGLIIANHQSYLDIPLLALQHQIPPLMKHEVIYLPVVGIVALAAGCIRVKRNNKDSRKEALVQCIRRLEQGIPLQYYPEGTRSKIGRPVPFEHIKRPLLDKAYDLKVKVTPVSLFGTNQVLGPKGKEFYHYRPVGIMTHLEVDPNNFSSKEEFAQHCWQQVISGYESLKAQC